MTALPSRYTPFSVSVVPNRDKVGVVVAGELDLMTSDAVAEAVGELWTTGFREVVLDLSQVEFIDSTALRMLLALVATAKRDGHDLVLVPAAPHAQRIFSITGTEQTFQWRDRFAH